MRIKRPIRKRQKLDRPKVESGEKNYFWIFLVAILLWSGTAATVLWSAPGTLTITIFFINLFMALFITFSILLANTRRGLLVTLVITFFLLLRLLKLGNLLNLALLVGAALSFELYRRG